MEDQCLETVRRQAPFEVAPARTVPLPVSAAGGRLFVARLPGRSVGADVEARDAHGKVLAPEDF